ncbi:2-oxoglutarate ferredoxin oxidoreductase subunit gamma [Hydrogenoanaerobacterium saccharovorans]|uniref:2-oxoglutarate ferredoxin oxidoreductase, gamma subunit n=1 Tax=Hydrogenoanaerobacterium saccharovorans TaxID=474960 RepID=A0A1H7ZUF5_9FIRM|nr:2-oxoacid:acceptor oxidoreductase family protein [Hydrogenoanaerobacterium saccharovorans]RPF48434.1 2-oxoglutarate ferredoxin oxidoreductase subunit gamma [Hydrogenoanaerobacterium saccharovorans]SEM60997.1 2-oxoglutarate ferredoxin oxidoreductase, gamma subunit [Hydrogenoanaerobacterium saccharovorans]
MASYNMVMAGFGGQGVLFSGKVIAYAGLIEDQSVSWLPSYGPEMRGGTANCSICVSDEPIGSPLVVTPNVLIAMNAPSYDRFIDAVEAGGTAIIDSTLVTKKCDRTDINVFYVPATELASEKGLEGLANIILVGKLLKETGFAQYESVRKAIDKCVSARKQHLKVKNIEAIDLGMSL